VQTRAVQTTRAQIDAACARLTGAICQVPPMHSALKHEGKPLYAYARAGVEIERTPRQITIHQLSVQAWQDERLVLEVHCSKGTYIRTLAQDLGELLGCGAHLSALRRTGSGPLSVDHAVSLSQLEQASQSQREAWLMDADTLLADVPVVRLAHDDAGRFLSGVRRRGDWPNAPLVRVYGPEPRSFLGSAHIQAGELISTRLLSPLEVQGLQTNE
jgi:tRNA pseudouridine55 synthase